MVGMAATACLPRPGRSMTRIAVQCILRLHASAPLEQNPWVTLRVARD
jgi:hypothetical protein